MNELGLLIQALIVAESGGNDRAIGDKHLRDKAYGPLQIRQPVCDDYNKAHGTYYRASDLVGDRALSKKICEWYLTTYGSKKRLGREPTFQDLARIWNGGPDGWRKPSTLEYWKKVERAMKELEKKPTPKVSKKVKKKKK